VQFGHSVRRWMRRRSNRTFEHFSAVPLLAPDRDDYIEAAALRNGCRRAGVQAGTIDALIAHPPDPDRGRWGLATGTDSSGKPIIAGARGKIISIPFDDLQIVFPAVAPGRTPVDSLGRSGWKYGGSRSERQFAPVDRAGWSA
jgi:hypothetical protein